MGFQAGQIITAGRLQRLQPKVFSATGTANTVLGVLATPLTGSEVVLTTETDGATYKCEAVFSLDININTTDYAQCGMWLDGTEVSGAARWSASTSDNFAMATQMWHGSIGTAGQHTFDLRGSKSGTTGEIRTLGAFTKILVTVYEEV